MSRSPALLLAAAVTAAFAVSASGAATRTVKVGDNFFVKDGTAQTVTVKQNTNVRWMWVGHSAHNVTVSKGPVRFKSTTKTSGTYSRRMTRRGTYKIYCTIHGAGVQSMTLHVVK